MTRPSAGVRRHGARHRIGFTIISLLMAIILLTVGMMSLAGANAQTINMQTLSQNRTNAISIARAHMEQVRTRDPWSIVSESAVTLNGDGQPSASGKFVRSLAVTVVRQNLIKIVVIVQYPRGTQPVQLTTSFFRGNGLSGA